MRRNNLSPFARGFISGLLSPLLLLGYKIDFGDEEPEDYPKATPFECKSSAETAWRNVGGYLRGAKTRLTVDSQ